MSKKTGRARVRRPPHRIGPARTSTAPPPPTNIARLRDRLRARLETIGFRESGGGAYRPEICPACGEDRKGNPWFGKRGNPDRMCERCFTAGKPLPDLASVPAKGSTRRGTPELMASAGSSPKPKSPETVGLYPGPGSNTITERAKILAAPETVRVYVLRPISEKGKDYYPGASFLTTPEHAAQLIAPPGAERKLKVERRLKIRGKVYILSDMIWPGAQGAPETNHPNLPLATLTPPKPRTPTSSDFEALEERARGAHLVQDVAYFMLDHVIDGIWRQADAQELSQLNEALHGLFERHVKAFGHYKPRLAAAVAEAGRKAIVEWYMSGPTLAEEAPTAEVLAAIKRGERIPVPIKEGEGLPELIKRFNDIQIPRSALKAQPVPQKTHAASGEANHGLLHLLVAYSVLESLLRMIKALPDGEQLPMLEFRLPILAQSLGYSARRPTPADLAKIRLPQPYQGARFLLHVFTGLEKDTVRKNITKARRTPLARLLNLI
jgi:hypothetical protein